MQIPSQLYIGGKWINSSTGETLDVTNPATGAVITKIQMAGEQDLLAAIAAAKATFDNTWRDTGPFERSRLLHAMGDAITRNQDFLARLETDDVGKPIHESTNIDVASAAATFHCFADICADIVGEVKPSPYNEILDYTVREPLGVIGAIIPWNFPFLTAARKIASALAAGNTMVIKPASWAPLSTLAIGYLCDEVGLPAGVLNIVSAAGNLTGKVFAESPDMEDITFTGSTSVGRGLYARCTDALKGCTLELGGKSPGLVMPDCDMDETVAGTLFGVYLNQGECCCALTRLVVHEKVYDEFVRRFVEGCAKIKIGDPASADTRMGPLVHPDHLRDVVALIDTARQEGATVAFGGNVLKDGALAKGSFLQPTVITDVTTDMRVWKEEIFGPVVVVIKARDEEEMVRLGNDTVYGLAASIWTTNLKTAHSLARRIHAGTVWFNLHNFVFPSAPYGGYKASGVGSELGKEGVLALMRTKNVMVSLFPEGFKWY